MKKSLFTTFLSGAILASAGMSVAQTPFQGYVSSNGNLGMGGSVMNQNTQQAAQGQQGQAAQPAQAGTSSPLATGREMSPDRVEGFNKAIEEAFPMTPDMIRQYRQIFDEQQRAILETDKPSALVDAGFISLEPGETPSRLQLAPGIASVIGFYDATGAAWPIDQYVVGSGENFEVVQLGDNANSLVMTPLTRLGWSNLVVRLRDEPKPVVLHVDVSNSTAHFRHDIQIARMGPNANVNMASARSDRVITEAGDSTLLSVLTRVDIPREAVPASVANVAAESWAIGESLFVRSRHALLSPSWTASLAGPDGIRVYQVPLSSMLLFSVDGRVTRASVELP